jgi:predicted nucleic acid-binding protein
MAIFIDTSALLAFLNQDDSRHPTVVPVMRRLLSSSEPLVTHNYVLLEATALVGRRFGLSVVQRLTTELVPALVMEWVDADLHAIGLHALLSSTQRRPSLVDCVSFAVMRRRGLTTAFVMDAHFAEQGFTCLP